MTACGRFWNTPCFILYFQRVENLQEELEHSAAALQETKKETNEQENTIAQVRGLLFPPLKNIGQLTLMCWCCGVVAQLEKQLRSTEKQLELLQQQLQNQDFLQRKMISPGTLDKAVSKALADARKQQRLEDAASSGISRRISLGQVEEEAAATGAPPAKPQSQRKVTGKEKAKGKAKAAASSRAAATVETDASMELNDSNSVSLSSDESAWEAVASPPKPKPKPKKRTAKKAAAKKKPAAAPKQKAAAAPARRKSTGKRKAGKAALSTQDVQQEEAINNSAAVIEKQDEEAEEAVVVEDFVAAEKPAANEPAFNNISPIRSIVSSVDPEGASEPASRMSPSVALRRRKLFGGNTTALSPEGSAAAAKPPKAPVPLSSGENGFQAPARATGIGQQAARKRRMIKPGLFKGSLGLNASSASASASSLFNSFRDGSGFRIPKLKVCKK